MVVAQLLSGKAAAEDVRNRLRSEVFSLGLQPGLAIVQVGRREDSNVYIRMKLKAAEDIGIRAVHQQLPRLDIQ